MQRLMGFVFILFLFSTLATSVQALQAAPECLEQADCGEGFACDMEINQCVADEDDVRLTECWSDEDCQEGEWCNFASLVGGDDSDGSGEREAEPVSPEGGNEDADAEPAEETGEEEGAGAPREMTGYCQSVSEESGGDEEGDEVGADTASAEETGAEPGTEDGSVGSSDEEGSSGSGGCAVSSSSDVDRGLVLLLALAAAFALLFPRAERRRRSL